MTTSQRLVGKAHDGAMKLAILQAKHLAGYQDGSIVNSAERLAKLGLRASLIHELTGIPQSNTSRIVKSVGNFKTGRRKTSIDDIFRNATTHQQISMFLVMVERQRKLNPAGTLLACHILDAVRSMCARAPSQLHSADWERLTEAALSLQSGALRLITCSACHTRHVVPSKESEGLGAKINESDRACPLCRITESVTTMKKKVIDDREVTFVTTIRQADNTVIPTLAADLFERRQRLRAAGVGEPKAATR